jgi:hypothetical protein
VGPALSFVPLHGVADQVGRLDVFSFNEVTLNRKCLHRVEFWPGITPGPRLRDRRKESDNLHTANMEKYQVLENETITCSK